MASSTGPAKSSHCSARPSSLDRPSRRTEALRTTSISSLGRRCAPATRAHAQQRQREPEPTAQRGFRARDHHASKGYSQICIKGQVRQAGPRTSSSAEMGMPSGKTCTAQPASDQVAPHGARAADNSESQAITSDPATDHSGMYTPHTRTLGCGCGGRTFSRNRLQGKKELGKTGQQGGKGRLCAHSQRQHGHRKSCYRSHRARSRGGRGSCCDPTCVGPLRPRRACSQV